MKIIFISGPSGSGKTTLSNKVIEKIKSSIVLNTDNYYKTGLISKLLSRFIDGYFDRSISFNFKLFKKDFIYILKNRISYHERLYNYENKTIKKFLNQKDNIQFLIVEGIFARDFSGTLSSQNYYFFELKIPKNECMKRVILRDSEQRGKSLKKAKNDFLKSWDIYYEKLNYERIKKNAKRFIITKETYTNIDQIIKKIQD